MKNTLLLILALAISTLGVAQAKIQLRSADKAECTQNSYNNLKASFSFSGLEATEFQNERGVFSTITMPNTVIGGSEGDPQVPAVNQLIAIPVGAKPDIRVTNFSATDYVLADYGINRLTPRQPDIKKDQDPTKVPFVMNEAAYQTRGLRSEPKAMVSVDGTMRGVQIGRMSIEPVSYDPVNGILRVFNDIEVEVSFEGADAKATEDLLVKTYSPYFNSLYKQLFNSRAILDVYDEHPDLYSAPVKMLVIANRMFEDCIQEWVEWKTTKGIYVDVNYTDNIGTTAAAIKTFIQNKYSQDAPTFLMIMGDKAQVPASATGSESECVTDLYYSSVDGDEFVDMFHSRFSAETVAQMTAMLHKSLVYEQYTMSDPSYLNNVLLIAGEDSGWGVTVGRPTIWYATNYYYNASHGFSNVHEFSHGTYTNCYSYLNTGVGFVNYTAHGSNTSWAGPSFTVSDVNNLTNEDKYFLAMGNCCQAADWGISGTCFGEAMVRAENKGAYAYIGSCPSTYWLNDYYFGVGPTSKADGTMPSMEETGTGCYDAIWNDDAYNTVNSILYIGNLAGNAAGALGYTLHKSTLYYWQAYHVLGDGSVMPYRVQPTANSVSHMAIVPIGMNTYEVSAVPGSYVAISKDGVLHGTALVDETGTVQVPIDPITSSGDVTICVTAPNRIPYLTTVPAAALEGAYISVDSYTPTEAHVGDNTNLSITFKNVGADATSGTTTVTLSSTDDNVSILTPTKTFGALATNATTTVSGFRFKIADGVADGTKVNIHYAAVNGSDTWEGNIVITAREAVLEYSGLSWDGGFTPGETLTLTAKFKNTGHYQATNATVAMTTTSSYITISNPSITVGNVAVGEEASCAFSVVIKSNCPETAVIPVTFTMNADGGLTAQGTANLKNTCNVVFDLADSYGDGWNSAALTVSFDDGSASQNLTISSGSSASYTLEVGNGVHVTLSWTDGGYDSECSFTVSYDGDLMIYELASDNNPSSGTLFEFNCNCAAASQTFEVSVSGGANGTATGGGEFNYGQSCTVTATANEGYFFVGWTANGNVVSNANPYTFIVTESLDLVATFGQGIEIGTNGGTSSFLPTYNYYNYAFSQQIYTANEIGDACTILSIAFYNAGGEKTRNIDLYLKQTNKSSFTSITDGIAMTASDKVFSGSVTFTANAWTTLTLTTPFEYDGTSNVVMVTDDNTGSYSYSPHLACSVYNTEEMQAFYYYSDDTNYNPLSPPTSTSTYNNSLASQKNHILLGIETDGTPHFSISATANPTEGGSISGAGSYEEGSTVTLTATAASGYVFDSWTENGTVVSTDEEYSFTAEENRTLVANFLMTITQSQTINLGWGWASFYVDLSGAQGLQQLEDALGDNATMIKGRNAFVQNSSSGWAGSLNTIEVETMYQINTTSSVSVSLNALPVTPEEHPITLSKGWNWIGYPCTTEQDVAAAMSAYTGANEDILKSHDAMTTYIEGYGWWGSLGKMTPGTGYMYKSNSTGSSTLTYSQSGKYDIPVHCSDVTDLHWNVDASAFSSNANIIATLDADGIKLSEQVEIGAFVDGECRGSAKLMYVEPLGQYVAFMTVYGNEDETMQFMAYDNGESFPIQESISYANDMVIGNTRNPMVLHADASKLVLYPNPVEKGQAIRIELPVDNASIEIFNTLGISVYSNHVNDRVTELSQITASGVYTIKATAEDGQTYYGKLIVK